MITLTEEAKEQIVKALQEQPDKSALRVEAETNGTSEFSYSMRLIEKDETLPDETLPEDICIKSGDLDVVIDPQSAEYLKGATI